MFKTVIKSLSLLTLILLLLVNVGCYEVDQEVILASSAMAVYGLPGDYTSADYKTNIAAVPNSNDYRFREVNKEGKASTGYLRAVLLRDNVYAVQVKYDNETVYYVLFYSFKVHSDGSKNYVPLEPTDYALVYKMAPQYGVDIDIDEFALTDILKGKRADIMNFLYAHKNVTLKPAK
ncbi:MAG: hypothetical protein EHM45_19765 [Desulfobacteraceae bacterium]|nr:MAG: hypothetical protein EHM45_19765 [Desulfobacteraceae bacterium]